MIQFIAYGIPQPKGSTKSFVINGKPVTTSDNTKLKPWHEVVAWMAQTNRPAGGLMLGPVSVELLFCFVRPKSVSVKKRPLPITKPDIDKLTRAVFDALTGTIYGDDSQVVELKVREIYDNPPRVEVKVQEAI